VVGVFAVQASGVIGSGPDLVAWSDAPLPTNKPQTDAEKEQGREQGRALPKPELLQPSRSTRRCPSSIRPTSAGFGSAASPQARQLRTRPVCATSS
jgi:hypothetical protein